MKALLFAFFALFPLAAADAAEFDLGFAHPGMTIDEFRAVAWPQGVSVRCSGEADLPPESETVRLAVPGPVARLGGTRCGLFNHDGGGGWRIHPLTVAGNGAEVWGKFFPDRAGTPRLVQLALKQPAQAFDALAADFTRRFGLPELREPGLVRWQGDAAEVAIIQDSGGRDLLAFVIDIRLQSALNARISHQPRHAGAKDPHQ